MQAIDEEPAVKPAGSDRFEIRFPKGIEDARQDEEWFEYRQDDGQWRRLRVHDYSEIFKAPGLYEALVYEALGCSSPTKVTHMLAMILEDSPPPIEKLRVLDLGAGNGIVAERLRKHGVKYVLGLDLLPEAEVAARRDHPEVYDDYIVADLCNLDEKSERELRDSKLNCLVTVAALGFGDIPANAFAKALSFVQNNGWIAMAIKEDFLTGQDDSGFSRLIRRMIGDGVIEVHAQYRFCHRMSLAGEKLFYVALVAKKLRDIPQTMLDSLDKTDDQLRNEPDESNLITDTFQSQSS